MPPLFILLPVLFLGSIVSTIAGGGLGILLTVAATFFTDVKTSVILVSFLGFVIQGAKIIHFWRDGRWDVIWWYLLLGVPCSFLGAWLLFLLPERTIQVGIALASLIFCATDLWPTKVRVVPSKIKLVFIGAVNGIVGGMIGQGGLLRSPALLSFGLTKHQFVGTSSIIALFMNIGKTSVYATQIPWDRYILLLLLLAMPLTYSGVMIGKRLLHYVHPVTFERILVSIVLVGSLRLLFFP